jgi:hypothetical protein
LGTGQEKHHWQIGDENYIRSLAKLLFATEKMSFKSVFSKVSVRSVTVFTYLCKRSIIKKSLSVVPSSPQKEIAAMQMMHSGDGL